MKANIAIATLQSMAPCRIWDCPCKSKATGSNTWPFATVIAGYGRSETKTELDEIIRLLLVIRFRDALQFKITKTLPA
jgi:hypothetical protein